MSLQTVFVSKVPSSNPAAEFLVLFVQKLVFIHQCVQLSFEPLDHVGLVGDGSSSFSQHFLMLHSLSIAGKILIRRSRGFRLRVLASAGDEVIFVVRCARRTIKLLLFQVGQDGASQLSFCDFSSAATG